VGENSAGNQRTCRKPENMQETREHAGNKTCRKPENMQETREHAGNKTCRKPACPIWQTT